MDKKNIAALVIMLIFVLGIVWIVMDGNTDNLGQVIKHKDSKEADLNYDEIKGVWLSYIELGDILKGKDKKKFEKNVDDVISNVKSLGFNTIILQVRAFSDSIYESKYFPWASYCTGEEGKSPGYDPLEIFITKCHKEGIRVEAWVNPYRVRSEASNAAVSEKNPAAEWIDEGSDNIVRVNGGIYYNPCKDEVRQLIVNGISEIVKNYKVDGIHFDDYFYPYTDNSFDEEDYNSYKSDGGELSREEWRRENVNTLVRSIYKEIKSLNSKVVFGISPQGNMKNNYNSQYIDVEKWVTNEGYVDYICPQVYYGFKNDANSFENVIKSFDDYDYKGVKLYVGLAPYKIGTSDKWAGAGENEWIESHDILKRQIEASKKLKNYGGYIMFRYGSLFNSSSDVRDAVNTEIENLKK